jgi:purine-binding chemotaxis protein CheW
MNAPLPARRKDEVFSRWVSFQLADQHYGIAILDVQEVLADADVEPVPRAPAEVLGVINLRGRIVTVVDMRARLGLPAQADVGRCVIIVEFEGQPVGLRVDRVAEVINVAASKIKPAPDTGAGSKAGRVHGIVSRSGDLLTLLNVAPLLATP